MSDWRVNGDNIGWTVSHPHQVTAQPGQPKAGTFATARRSITASQGVSAGVTASRRTAKAAAGPSQGGGKDQAWSRYRWAHNPRYRFEWEAGQSLSTPPLEGSQMGGRWSEGGDGTGRVTLRNGGMVFSSDAYNSAPSGPSGDTWAGVVGAQARFGRWEVRGLTTQLRGSGPKYRVRYELVPTRSASQRCGTAGIVLAESSGPGTPLRFGVRGTNGAKWGRTIGQSRAVSASSIAVQVTRKHITWFVNGKPTGTVRARAAIPKGPMAVRISMVGEGRRTMTSAKHTTDWVRSFTLKYGKKPTSKIKLRKGAAYGGC